MEIALQALMDREKAAGRPYTQEAIAEKVGMAQGTLSRWVGNKIDRVDIDILERLCEYFECDVNDILVTKRIPNK